MNKKYEIKASLQYLAQVITTYNVDAETEEQAKAILVDFVNQDSYPSLVEEIESNNIEIIHSNYRDFDRNDIQSIKEVE